MQNSLRFLYHTFLQMLEKHPEIFAWQKSSINNSGLFYEAAGSLVDELLENLDQETFIPSVKQTVYACGMHHLSQCFIGAIYAAAAARLLEKGNASFARRLAEESIACSQFDLFAQDIILEASHRLDPTVRSIADTKEWLKTRFCMFPFTKLETTTGGQFYRCCPSYVPKPIGSFDDGGDLDTALNSPAANDIRDSIMDGSFRYCSKLHCPYIGSRHLMSREEGLEKLKTVDPYPEEVVLSHDFSCNLSCPSCRRERIVIPKSEQDKFDSLSEKLFMPLLKHAKTARVCGSGDPFASIHFRNLLRDYCRSAPEKTPKFILHTNAVLCDKKAWDDIGLWGHVRAVYVSIDAAKEETYSVVRRDGNFKRLLENMRFLADLRKTGEISSLLQSFVVQARNFREMPDFIRMGHELGIGSISFTQMRNWGTFSPEEFARQCVTSPDHPDHQELLILLKDPIFDQPGVDLCDINNLRPKKTAVTQQAAST